MHALLKVLCIGEIFAVTQGYVLEACESVGHEDDYTPESGQGTPLWLLYRHNVWGRQNVG